RPRMCRVRNRMIRCPGVSLWLRPARVAVLAHLRRASGSHRAAARAGGKPRRYALAGGLLPMMLVLPTMAGRLPGADAARAAPPARVATLQSPQPPTTATTFVWSVPGLSTRAGQHIMTLYLSGCWAAWQIARVT